MEHKLFKMHELATDIINKNIEKIIDNHSYENQKNVNPYGCICYGLDAKCHNIENLNCFFCYCPNYDRTILEGKCKIDSLMENILKLLMVEYGIVLTALFLIREKMQLNY